METCSAWSVSSRPRFLCKPDIRGWKKKRGGGGGYNITERESGKGYERGKKKTIDCSVIVREKDVF